MDTFEVIILFIFIIGIGYILYLILRDPVLMLKTFLRGLKPDNNWRLIIVLFPIWGPIWLLDRLFSLNLYIKDFEDASQPKKIDFADYDKYIQIDTYDSGYIEEIIKSF